MMNADDLQCTAQGCCNTAQSYGLCASHLSRVQTRDLSQTSFMDAGQNTSLRTSPTTHHRPQGLTSSAHYDTPTSIQSGSENSDDGGGQHDSVVRRERNRIAARKSRQRKLDKIQHLENEKGRLEGHRNRLINEIRMLESRMEGSLGTTKKVLTDDEYEALQNERVRVIEDVHAMYNARNIEDSTKYFREDSIVSGPQNSVHLRAEPHQDRQRRTSVPTLPRVLALHWHDQSNGIVHEQRVPGPLWQSPGENTHDRRRFELFVQRRQDRVHSPNGRPSQASLDACQVV
ncbi:hypothetical protein, variant [Aphanomyces invadans]|uniref:BZIP domain-containing protein n=1 Tax=Aphanomyces invadans TaxID=157072 RepID=A0A024ULY9_9STRA|nr:hypothetical protein, variant [Aphanomyces invadans]ETW06638.1 hypothetical protein, variant [Aphanomyces invadans]|eukprot:XP_008864713.1 hypothetical protein, variant [Aphanomyces invadans]